MALDRLILQAGTALQVSASIQEELTALWNRSVIQLGTIGGTGNAITAVCSPVLTGGTVVAGMKFSFVAAANNSGATTIAIDGGTPVAITSIDGNPLTAGSIVLGRLYQIEAVSGSFRLSSGGGGGATYNRRRFLVGGLWTKPDGLIKVVVRVRGAGGGGGGVQVTSGHGGGGGGGGEAVVEKLASSLGSTETVTIGASGTGGTTSGTGGTGGTSSFGVHAVATGGAGGAPGTSFALVAGGNGGQGTAGDILMKGQSGVPGGYEGGTVGDTYVKDNVTDGRGGASPTGGFNLTTANAVGVPGGANTGAGGSGGNSMGSATDRVGGAGGSGYVEVEEFF